MNIIDGLSYDDILLIPKYSEVQSRSLVDTSVDLGKNIKLKIPIITANMKNICEEDMANAISSLGGLGILHRFCSIEEQISIFRKCQNPDLTGASLGIQEEDKERAEKLAEAGCKIFCLDVAHAHNKFVGEMTNYLAKTYPSNLLIAGNVATGEGANFLYEKGADVVKVNIGSGSICSTRIETGNGVPTITALDSVAKVARGKYKVIADGGITSAGNLSKSLCFADAAMLGSLLAGTDETPGSIIYEDGRTYKRYDGSSTFKNSNIEGVQSLVPTKGPVKNIVQKLLDGLRSSLSYQGVDNLNDLKKDPQFVKITSAGLKESHPHSVRVI